MSVLIITLVEDSVQPMTLAMVALLAKNGRLLLVLNLIYVSRYLAVSDNFVVMSIPYKSHFHNYLSENFAEIDLNKIDAGNDYFH